MGKSNFLLYLGGEKVTLVVIIPKRSLLSLLIQQRASLIVFMIKRILVIFGCFPQMENYRGDIGFGG